MNFDLEFARTRREDEGDNEGDLEFEEPEEQPSLITSSELRSIDLNVLGEWYIPSSDVFSEHKDDNNHADDTEEDENREEVKEIEVNIKNRNYMFRKNSRCDNEKICNNEATQIDEMIRKSIDNFINETKDILKPSPVTQNDENAGISEFEETKKSSFPYYPQKNAGTFQRSASQKYNYKRPKMHDNESRFLHISPLNSWNKRSAEKKINKAYLIPHPNQNFAVPPRYTSLVPNQFQQDNDTYFAQNKDFDHQYKNYSFNMQRRTDNINDMHQNLVQNIKFQAMQNTSYDENMIPSNIQRAQNSFVNIPQQISSSTQEFYYHPEETEMRPNIQNHKTYNQNTLNKNFKKNAVSSDKSSIKYKNNMHFPESKNIEYSPNSGIVNPRNKHTKVSNNTIYEEEQESKFSKEESKIDHHPTHVRTHNSVNYDNSAAYPPKELTFTNDETLHTTALKNHGKGFYSTPQQVDKRESAENQLDFIRFNIYEIINKNKITIKHSSEWEANSHDFIIKMFENAVHELRLK